MGGRVKRGRFCCLIPLLSSFSLPPRLPCRYHPIMTTTASASTASDSVAQPVPTCSLCARRVAWRRRSLNGFTICHKCWVAFVNRRQAAFLFDFLVCFVLSYLPVWVILVDSGSVAILKWVVWLAMAINTLLFAFKDGFSGYSPGKYLMGIQVVDMATRQPAGFWQSFKRNILLSLPYVKLIPILVITCGFWKGRRLGDRWAGTMVVWRKHARKPPFNPISTVCIPCGYDLTGNVSGICPECGSPIPEATRRLIADAQCLPQGR